MNINVKIYQPQANDKYTIPVYLANLQQWAVKLAASIMQVYGIQSVTTQLHLAGVKQILNVSYKPFAIEGIPEAIRTLTPSQVRPIAEFLLTYGIMSIELSLDKDDINTLKQNWVQLFEQQPSSQNNNQVAINNHGSSVIAESNPAANNNNQQNERPKNTFTKLSAIQEIPLNFDCDPQKKV